MRQLEVALARMERTIDDLRSRQPKSSRSSSGSLVGRIRTRLGLTKPVSPADSASNAECAIEDLNDFAARLRRRAAEEISNGEEWERRAMLCVTAHDDELAREALARRQESLTLAAELEREARTVEGAATECRRALDEFLHALPPRSDAR